MIPDYYPTPNWCFEYLVRHIDFSRFDRALEPCEGDGRITRFLRSFAIETVSFDIQGNPSVDYLRQPMIFKDLIMTNPPYSQSFAFVKKAVNDSNVAIMLLRLSFLGSQIRKEWLTQHEPTGLIVLSKRPSFKWKKTDNSEYAWFIWDKVDKTPKGILHV